ncbi:MAG: ABC transporter permease [Bacteroidales bacterium]|nr:ABC transporter permease [Bacteroidales bacterium]
MRDIFQDIFSSLRQNKLRTALTGFSVAWGIFMLIALLGAGNGVFNALLSNSGTMDRSMVIYPQRTGKPYAGYEKGRRIRLDVKDVEYLESEMFADHVDEVCPVVQQMDSLVYGDRFMNVELIGLTPVFQQIQNVQIAAGRFINELDGRDRRKVVVLGTTEAEQLAGAGNDPSRLVGRQVRIGSFSWQVVGLAKSDESMGGGSPQLYAPYSTVSLIYGKDNEIPQVFFSFKDLDTDEESEKFESAYRSVVNSHHSAAPDDENTLYFWNRMSSSRQMDKVTRILRTALWILGLFTLISGIVGVSNIMLITVKERTHEFGIRKAIGARPASLLKLVITEAVVITAVFGYVGMFLGMVANQIMDKTLGDAPIDAGIVKITMFVNPTVGLDVAVKATLLLIVAGTLAGLIPAWKASKVKPIEALRAE